MKGIIKGIFAGIVMLLVLTACTTIQQSQSRNLSYTSKVAIFPFVNNTTTVQAGHSAMSMVAHLLDTCNLQVYVYPRYCQSDAGTCQANRKRQQSMLRWAKNKGIRYAIKGNVNEWRYKVGLDGEPAASVALSIVDLKTNRTIWSSVGSRTGGSRSSLGNTAQALLSRMLKNVRWQ